MEGGKRREARWSEVMRRGGGESLTKERCRG